MILDELAPDYIRERRIDLSTDDQSPPPRAFAPVLVTVSYTRCKPEGVMLPLVLEVQGSSSASYQRREFTGTAPDSVSFTPIEGGDHLVVLREVAHNRWFGSLRISIDGELLEPPKFV